jgi:7-carboxy-7-deazaguanine synthase
MQNFIMKIIETFTSLQGEGSTSGYPTIFVRLGGCNLSCSYCDTPDSRIGGDEIFVSEVFDLVIRQSPRYVCITGGEPLLQLEEVLDLADRLKTAGKTVSIETNGTLPFDSLFSSAIICMDVKCPSSGESSNLTLLKTLRDVDSVKFVVGTAEDLMYAEKVIINEEISAEIYISPVYGTDYNRVADFILNNNLPARMQVQLHKIIGVP